MATVEQMIEQVLNHANGRPMWEVMRQDESDLGNVIVYPGDEAWLPADDWDETVTVSRSGKEVRLVAILAKTPGRGSFRRLVDGIIAEGLTPVVVAPTTHMRATLQRWKWAMRSVGSGWAHEEQWRPKKGWRHS